MNLDRTSIIVGLAVTGLAGLWWSFDHVSTANDDHDEQIVLVEAVDKLTKIHIRQATVEEAELAMIEKLCRAGKLDPIDCPGMLPAVSAPAPPPEEIE
jgi:hypothetical protein